MKQRQTFRQKLKLLEQPLINFYKAQYFVPDMAWQAWQTDWVGLKSCTFYYIGFYFIFYFIYLDTVTGSVISELTEQLCQESLGCCPGEETRRTAGESRDPLCPVLRHYRSNPDYQLSDSVQSHSTPKTSTLDETFSQHPTAHSTQHTTEFRVMSRAYLILAMLH